MSKYSKNISIWLYGYRYLLFIINKNIVFHLSILSWLGGLTYETHYKSLESCVTITNQNDEWRKRNQERRTMHSGWESINKKCTSNWKLEWNPSFKIYNCFSFSNKQNSHLIGRLYTLYSLEYKKKVVILTFFIVKKNKISCWRYKKIHVKYIREN